MKNTQKGFNVLLLMVIIAVLAIGGLGAFYMHKKSQQAVTDVSSNAEKYYNTALDLFSKGNPCGDSDDEIFKDLSKATQAVKGDAYAAILMSNIKASKLYTSYKSNLNFREAIGDLDPKTWAGLEGSLSEAVFFGPQPGVAVLYMLNFMPEGKLEHYTPFDGNDEYNPQTEIWLWKLVSKESEKPAQVLITDDVGKQSYLDLTKVFIGDNTRLGYFLLSTEDKMHIKNNTFISGDYYEPSYSNTNLNQCSA